MITKAQSALLESADANAVLPGIDTQTGNSLPSSSMKPLSSMTTNTSAPFFYYAPLNEVVVKQAGAVLSGYNFGTAWVNVMANNVTIENSNFAASTTGYWSIDVEPGVATATVTHNTFDSGLVPSAASAWIGSRGLSTVVTDNTFINTPGDGIDLEGGVVSGNYFSGVGNSSTGVHADAIWVSNSQGPTTISDNVIDWTADGTESYLNNTVRITAETGNVSNVTVTGNYLLGGSYTVDAYGGPGTFSNISITNNYIGFGAYGAFYPSVASGVAMSGNTIFDFSNPIYSSEAWAAYRAAGIPTAKLVVSSGASIGSSTSASPTTLYGDGYAVHMCGGIGENNFVGGAGTQYITGGAGANIFTYLSPADSTANHPDVISSFDPAKDVIDLSHIDADLTAAGIQNFTFIGTAAFSGAGAQVRYQQDPTKNVTWVEADLAGDSSPDIKIELGGLVTPTAANFALTAAQSSAALADGAAMSVSYTRSASAVDYSYTHVVGRPYSSFQAIYGPGHEADNLDLSSTANELELYGNALTITRGSGAETMQFAWYGTAKFSLGYHASETIDASGSGSDAFVFGSNFGAETINGFTASGANADTMQLSLSSFSYLNSGMTQAQDLAAVLANATTSGSNTTIHDSKGDSLTLGGLTPSTIAASPNVFHFV